MKNLLLAGLWFGTEKENTSLYLSPVVDHIKDLSKGFSVKINGEATQMKAYLIACVADSVARCDIQGIHGHRGDYPCNWCLIEGEEWGGVRIFRPTVPPAPLRTIQGLLEDAREALRTGIFTNGVKYLSLLGPAPLFHVVDGFILDQMHAKDEGTTKSFLKTWLGPGNRPYHINTQENLAKISRHVKSLSVPRELRRRIRNLEHLAYWTARELENFEFYVSIPVFVDILPKRYLKHWALYVQGTYILLHSSLSYEAIDIAEELLIQFCMKVEDYYDPFMLRFCLHLLIHFAQNVRRWGPMYALSSNAFEAGIHSMKKLIHNANYIPSQIARALSEDKALGILKRESMSALTNHFEEVINRKAQEMKILEVGPIKLIGKPKVYRNPTQEEHFILSQKGLPLDNWMSYKSLIKNGTHYGPKPQSGKCKVDNSNAKLEGNTFIRIEKILFNEGSHDIVVFARRIRCQPSEYCPLAVRNVPAFCFQFLVSSIDGDLQVYDPTVLRTICVSLELDHGHYLCPMPNVYNMF